MKITINCDQVDCRFNVQQFKGQVGEGRCSHPHPFIDLNIVGSNITICHTKEFVKDFVLPPSCQSCETSDSDQCINCCHKPKDELYDAKNHRRLIDMIPDSYKHEEPEDISPDNLPYNS